MKPIKSGLTVIKSLIWNKVESESGYDVTECEITFNDKSSIKYECDDIEDLEDKNMGIYELLPDGSYIQIEDWEN